jgi:hypothetical protein
MPFPFIPAGLLLALTVLGASIATFGLALKAMDWSIDAARRSPLTGIVSGLRDWQGSPSTATDSPPSSPTEVEESVAALERLESVAHDRTGPRLNL